MNPSHRRPSAREREGDSTWVSHLKSGSLSSTAENAKTKSGSPCQRTWQNLIRRVFFLTVLVGPVILAEDRPKNPHKAQPASLPSVKANQRALFTTEKTKPSKTERHAVLEDYKIPRAQWKNYVVEYRVPIRLGGSNAYTNIEVLHREQARIKHKVQKQLETKFRHQGIGLNEAQQRILNWTLEPLARQSDFDSSGTGPRRARNDN
jgi:hypothetical protein